MPRAYSAWFGLWPSIFVLVTAAIAPGRPRRFLVSDSLSDETIGLAVSAWLVDEAQATISYGHISDWNVSKVSNFDNLFLNAHHFNADLNSWDTSRATRMKKMFQNTLAFNGNLGSWDTSGGMERIAHVPDTLHLTASIRPSVAPLVTPTAPPLYSH